MAVNMGSAVAFLELDTSKFSSGFKSAMNDLKVFGSKSATAEQKVKGLSSAMISAGSTLTKGLTLPLAGVGAASLKVATDFESGMAEVKAISGATGKDFKALSDKAKQMGATTKFSATQASEAFKYMAMAGWDTNDMLNSISGVMNLAAASGEDLASVSDIVTDAMTAFGLSADGTSKVMKDGYEKEVSNATRFTDVLAKASSNSNTNVSMMGETFKYVAPVAGALGYSVEDTATAIGLMANSGIKGSQAGTALRSTLSRLAKPTKTVQAVMDKYNISLTDSQGQMKPLKQLMEELRGTFGNLSQAEQASVAASLAGQEGMSGLMAIVNSSDEDFNKLSDSIYNANGACDEMSETMLNTTKGSLELLKSALEGAGIVIGERLQPYIRKLAEWIQKLAEWFTNLSDKQLDFIVKAGLIVAAVGPVLTIFGKLLDSGLKVFNAFKRLGSGFESARKYLFGFDKEVKQGTGKLGETRTYVKHVTGVFEKLKGTLVTNTKSFGLLGGTLKTVGGVFKTLFSAINPIVILIGILVAAFVTLWKTNEDFRNKMKEIWSELKQVFSDFVNGVKQRFEDLGIDFGKITEGLKKAWETFCNILAPLFTTTFQTIVDFISGVLDVILGIIDVFIGIFTGNFDKVKQGIYEIFSGIVDFISDFVGNILDLVSGVLEALGFDGAAEKVQSFKETVQKGIEDVKNFIAQIPQAIVDVFNTINNFFNVTLPEAVAGFIKGIVDKIKEGIQKIKDTFSAINDFFNVTIPEAVAGAIQSVIDFLANGVNTIILFFTETIPNALSTFFSETIPNAIDAFFTFLSELPYKLGVLIGEMLGTIYNFAVDLKDWIITEVPLIIESVITFIKELPGKIWDLLVSVVTKVQEFGTNLNEKIQEVATSFVDKFIEFITSLPDKIWNLLVTVVTKVQEFGTNLNTKIKEIATNMVNKFIQFIKNLPSKVWNLLLTVISKVKQFGSQVVSKAKEIATNFVNSFINFVKNLPTKLMSILKQIPQKILALGATLRQAGAKIITSLWEGIKSIATSVLDWVKDFADSIKSFFQGVIDGFKKVKDKGAEAREISRSVNGSHANGLDYVPFNGYVAELHKGERVLTAEENKRYNEGKTGTGGDTFNFYNTKPNPYEYARQMKQAKKELLYGF